MPTLAVSLLLPHATELVLASGRQTEVDVAWTCVTVVNSGRHHFAFFALIS